MAVVPAVVVVVVVQVFPVEPPDPMPQDIKLAEPFVPVAAVPLQVLVEAEVLLATEAEAEVPMREVVVSLVDQMEAMGATEAQQAIMAMAAAIPEHAEVVTQLVQEEVRDMP